MSVVRESSFCIEFVGKIPEWKNPSRRSGTAKRTGQVILRKSGAFHCMQVWNGACRGSARAALPWGSSGSTPIVSPSRPAVEDTTRPQPSPAPPRHPPPAPAAVPRPCPHCVGRCPPLPPTARHGGHHAGVCGAPAGGPLPARPRGGRPRHRRRRRCRWRGAHPRARAEPHPPARPWRAGHPRRRHPGQLGRRVGDDRRVCQLFRHLWQPADRAGAAELVPGRAGALGALWGVLFWRRVWFLGGGGGGGCGACGVAGGSQGARVFLECLSSGRLVRAETGTSAWAYVTCVQ